MDSNEFSDAACARLGIAKMELMMEKVADRRVVWKASLLVNVDGLDSFMFIFRVDEDVDTGEECFGEASALHVVHRIDAIGATATANVSVVEIISFIVSINGPVKGKQECELL